MIWSAFDLILNHTAFTSALFLTVSSTYILPVGTANSMYNCDSGCDRCGIAPDNNLSPVIVHLWADSRHESRTPEGNPLWEQGNPV